MGVLYWVNKGRTGTAYGSLPPNGSRYIIKRWDDIVYTNGNIKDIGDLRAIVAIH